MSQDNVVQHSNSQDSTGSMKALRALAVFATRGGVTGRVIMQEYKGSRAVPHRGGKHLAWMDHGCAQTSERNQDLAYQLILGVKVQRQEMLSVGSKELGSITEKEIPAV